jgi:hypothetical protein
VYWVTDNWARRWVADHRVAVFVAWMVTMALLQVAAR